MPCVAGVDSMSRNFFFGVDHLPPLSASSLHRVRLGDEGAAIGFRIGNLEELGFGSEITRKCTICAAY